MEVRAYLDGRKHIGAYLVYLLNHSFPLLSYFSFKYGLNEQVCHYPLKLVYEEPYCKEFETYADLVSDYITERLTPHACLTAASLIAFCREHNIEKSIEANAVKELGKIYEETLYSNSVVKVFCIVDNNDDTSSVDVNDVPDIEQQVKNLGYYVSASRKVVSSRGVGQTAPYEYRRFLSEAHSLQVKAKRLLKDVARIDASYIEVARSSEPYHEGIGN